MKRRDALKGLLVLAAAPAVAIPTTPSWEQTCERIVRKASEPGRSATLRWNKHVKFHPRMETVWGDRWGVALRVEDGDRRWKNAVAYEGPLPLPRGIQREAMVRLLETVPEELRPVFYV